MGKASSLSRLIIVDTKLTGRVDQVESKLTERINSIESKLTERIDRIEEKLTSRIDNLQLWAIDAVFAIVVGSGGTIGTLIYR